MKVKMCLTVVCSDIEGKKDDIPVACFPLDNITDALNLCVTVRKFGGKWCFSFDKFLET